MYYGDSIQRPLDPVPGIGKDIRCLQAHGETKGRNRRVAAATADWPRGRDVGKPSQSVFSTIERIKGKLKEREYD